MAEEESMEAHYAEMDYTAHNNTYAGFLGLLKWGSIAVAIITVFVLILIT